MTVVLAGRLCTAATPIKEWTAGISHLAARLCIEAGVIQHHAEGPLGRRGAVHVAAAAEDGPHRGGRVRLSVLEGVVGERHALLLQPPGGLSLELEARGLGGEEVGGRKEFSFREHAYLRPVACWGGGNLGI